MEGLGNYLLFEGRMTAMQALMFGVIDDDGFLTLDGLAYCRKFNI